MSKSIIPPTPVMHKLIFENSNGRGIVIIERDSLVRIHPVSKNGIMSRDTISVPRKDLKGVADFLSTITQGEE